MSELEDNNNINQIKINDLPTEKQEQKKENISLNDKELKFKNPDFYRNKIILAPMVRTGELPMRLTALQYGADLVYTPEIVDKRIIGSERIWNVKTETFDYIKKGRLNFRTKPSEKSKLIFQMGTADPDLALQAALTVINDVSGIDVNCGCPKRFSIQGGMGAALLEDPDRLIKILKNLVDNLNVPVTCKIRIFEDEQKTLDLCKRLEATGISALAVHVRTRDERPAQPAHWDRLPAIVDTIKSIPVIINGDCFQPKDLNQVKSITGASSIMIARGAMLNPSIFLNSNMLPLRDAVIQYVKHSIDTDFIYQNVKYTLSTMYHDPKSLEFKVLIKAKSVKEISEAFDLMDYFDETQKLFQQRELNHNQSIKTINIDSVKRCNTPPKPDDLKKVKV